MNQEVQPSTEKKPRPWKKILIISGIVLLAALVVGLNIYRSGQKDVTSVSTTKVEQRAMVQKILASGKVAVASKEVLYSQNTGTIKKINVHLGQKVAPGQVLMEVDMPDADSRLAQAKSTLAAAETALAKTRLTDKPLEIIEAEYTLKQAADDAKQAKEKLAKYQELYEAGAVSKDELDSQQSTYNTKQAQYEKAKAALVVARVQSAGEKKSAEASYQSALASLKLVQKQVGQKGLSSTIGGQVMSLSVQEGDVITAGTQLITIGDVDSLLINADITEADAPMIKAGQEVVVTSPTIQDKKWKGVVREVGLEAVSKIKNSSETSAIQVIIALKEKSELRPGFTADLEIITARNNKALTVPFEALSDRKGKTWVFVVHNQTAHLQEVKTGMSDTLRIQVKSGIKKGDKVILNPPAKLKDGSKVKVQ
ncbi:MAG: efflux RND transporter periplasmic adaptor subunit [Chitinophagales bacterium]